MSSSFSSSRVIKKNGTLKDSLSSTFYQSKKNQGTFDKNDKAKEKNSLKRVGLKNSMEITSSTVSLSDQ